MSVRLLLRLAQVTGYPMEEVEIGAKQHTFAVDGYEVAVQIVGEKKTEGLRFSCAFEIGGDQVVELVKLAAGRILKETATLAYDAEKKHVFLWDEVEGTASDGELKARFGKFLDSCDWWRERVKELEEKPIKVEEMVIRP